jgi:gluconokinase
MIIIVLGVSGSGKSTIGAKLARALDWTFVDADAFHPPANIQKMSRGVPLNDEDRRPWLSRLRQEIEGWLRDQRHVVLACSALTNGHRRILLVDEARIKLVYLKGSYDLIQARLARRSHHFMPKELLKSQFETLEEPTNALTIDTALTPDRIVSQIRNELHV